MLMVAKALSVTAIVLVGILFVFMINPGGIIPQDLGGGVPTSPQDFGASTLPPGDYFGPFSVDVNNFDSLDITETRADGTDIVTTFYTQDIGGRFNPESTSVGGTAALHAEPSSPKMFFSVEPAAGKDFYADAVGITERNNRVLSFDFIDINNDRSQEFVFEYDVTGLGGIGRQAGSNPEIPLKILSYDLATVTLTSQGDITGVGQSIQTSRLKFDMDFASSETAIANLEYEVRFNSTDNRMWQESTTTLDIPFGDEVQSVRLTEFDRQETATETIYTWDISDDLGGANFIAVCSSCDTNVELPLVIDTNFNAAGEGLLITVKITEILPDQSLNTISASGKILEA